MRHWLLCSLGFLALSAVARPCTYSYVPHVPGEAFRPRPKAVIEVLVVEVRDENEMNGFLSTPVQNGIVEVIRSLHGPHRVGERLPTRAAMNNSCSTGIRVDQVFTMWLRGELPPYKPGHLSGPGEYEMELMFREIADVTGEPRQGNRPALGGVLLRGEISDRAAEKLLQRAKLDSTGCEVRRAVHFAQVGCGSAFDGNDVQSKVIFERVSGRWREVFRWAAPVSQGDAAAATRS